MSKRVSELQSDFEKEAGTIRSALGSDELDATGISVAGIGTISENYTVYNDGYATDVVTVTKYTFNGVTYNTQGEANSVRNREIDSKKSIVSAKMSKCDSYKSKLDKVDQECDKSIRVLKKDVQSVEVLERKIERTKSVSTIFSGIISSFN